jgi:hypothetical protein
MILAFTAFLYNLQKFAGQRAVLSVIIAIDALFDRCIF